MLKITKFGLIVNMVNDIGYHLSLSEFTTKSHYEALSDRHYYQACALRDNLLTLGIGCEFITATINYREYFIGVGIKDNTKGAPAFKPCSRYVFINNDIDHEAYVTYLNTAKSAGYDVSVIPAESKKIFGCK